MLQDNVLIPDDFAKYICHIGNVTDMHSITSSRTDSRRKACQKKRDNELFFTAVNPIEEHRFPENARYDLDKARIAVYKNVGKVHQNAVYWCNLNLPHRRGLQFRQTRSHAIVLFDTLPAICTEKVVYMKTEEELYSKVHKSPRIPRIVLKPNPQYQGRHDLPQKRCETICRSARQRERVVRGNPLRYRGLPD